MHSKSQGTLEELGPYGKSYNFRPWKLDNYPAAINVPEKTHIWLIFLFISTRVFGFYEFSLVGT